MENAAQALLIAGGILLAILTVTLLVYMFNNAAIIGNANEKKEELERIAAWNAEWEAYNKIYLYGTDVLTVLNKAEQNNIDDKTNIVKIYVKDENNIEVIDTKGYMESRKTNLFICENVEYSEKSGKVNKMIFKFVE